MYKLIKILNMQGEQPLLFPSQNKEELLTTYIHLFTVYQQYINYVNKTYAAYFLIHTIASIAFNLYLFAFPALTVRLATLSSVQLLWGISVLCFGGYLTQADPHSLGLSFNLYITKLRVTQIYAITLIMIFSLLLLRNILVSKSIVLLVFDTLIVLLAFRDILKIHNMENQALRMVSSMRAQQFYLVPLIKAEEADEPFQTDGQRDDVEMEVKKGYLFSYKKYYKPIKRKPMFLQEDEQIQYQIYSH